IPVVNNVLDGLVRELALAIAGDEAVGFLAEIEGVADARRAHDVERLGLELVEPPETVGSIQVATDGIEGLEELSAIVQLRGRVHRFEVIEGRADGTERGVCRPGVIGLLEIELAAFTATERYVRRQGRSRSRQPTDHGAEGRAFARSPRQARVHLAEEVVVL